MHPTSTARLPAPARAGRSHLEEHAIRALWLACALVAVLAVGFILAFLVVYGLPAFAEIGVLEVLLGDSWSPTATPPAFGILPLAVGTLLVTLGAMLFAVPLSVATAIYLGELAPPRVRNLVRPAIELLAGIPSVVFGFFGLIVLVEWLRVSFAVPSGESVLAGSLLLGVMTLPTIISVSEDAISSVPREFREGSLALGATRWQTIRRVVVPSALPGVTAAIILGMGRAIGETMAVMMVTGNAAVIPSPITDVLSPVRTLTGTLGIEMGEVAIGSLHYHALFAVATVLLVITLAVNLGASAILRRLNASATGRGSPSRLAAVLGRPRAGMAVPVLAAVLAAAVAHSVGGLLPALAVFAAGLLLLAAVPRLSRNQAEKAAFLLLYLAVAAVVAILAIILLDIVSKGLPALSWEFLTGSPRDLGRAGGIFPAIVGTLCLVAGAIALALPLGVGAAIHLAEYRRENRLTRLIRSGVDLLNGTPSIVFGLFGFTFFVLYLEFGVSMLAGQVTLGLMVLPTIIRTTEEALRQVPQGLREGSLALGATQWQTVRRVVLPPAAPGILTGTILSVGRAAGETAPILFTAAVFSQRHLPSSLLDPVMALPYHLFVLATNVPGAQQNTYGTALVLILLVGAVYAVTIAVRARYRAAGGAPG
ncbi:MAG: phosphate ABC transporter permease PstA [Methanospirillum sp.]|nr:phosphate ABC transporter permease PstA [Methanospirillum sp.]